MSVLAVGERTSSNDVSVFADGERTLSNKVSVLASGEGDSSNEVSVLAIGEEVFRRMKCLSLRSTFFVACVVRGPMWASVLKQAYRQDVSTWSGVPAFRCCQALLCKVVFSCACITVSSGGTQPREHKPFAECRRDYPLQHHRQPWGKVSRCYCGHCSSPFGGGGFGGSSNGGRSTSRPFLFVLYKHFGSQDVHLSNR